jgi:hypothetical protein
VASSNDQRMMISTRRFCASRTPAPVGTSRLVSPSPWALMALCGTPSRTSSAATARARRSERPWLSGRRAAAPALVGLRDVVWCSVEVPCAQGDEAAYDCVDLGLAGEERRKGLAVVQGFGHHGDPAQWLHTWVKSRHDQTNKWIISLLLALMETPNGLL